MGTGATLVALVALALGVLGVLAGLVPARSDEELPRKADARAGLGLAGVGFALVLLAFLLTLRAGHPFEEGQRLGLGLLLGGFAALFYLLVAAVRPGPADTPATVAMGVAAATVGVAAAFLLEPGGGAGIRFPGREGPAYPNPVLAGVAPGMALVLLLVEGTRGIASRRVPMVPGAAVAVLTATALAGACLLAIARYEELPRAERLAVGMKAWWAFPLAVAAGVTAGQLLLRFLGQLLRRTVGAQVVAILGAGLIALLVQLWLGSRLYTPLNPEGAGPNPYVPLIVSFVGGWISGIILRLGAHGAVQPHQREPGALLAAVVILALLVSSYRVLGGYGVSLAALGLLTAAPWSLTPTGATHSVPAAYLLAVTAVAVASLFRVFYSQFGLGEADVRLAPHYVLVGLVAGALGPFVYSALARAGGMAVARILGALALLGSTVLLPGVLVLFWGPRAGGGLLLGLALGLALMGLLVLLEPEPAEAEDGSPRVGRVAAATPIVAVLLAAWMTVVASGILDYWGSLVPRTGRLVGVALLVLLLPLWSLLLARASSRTR